MSRMMKLMLLMALLLGAGALLVVGCSSEKAYMYGATPRASGPEDMQDSFGLVDPNTSYAGIPTGAAQLADPNTHLSDYFDPITGQLKDPVIYGGVNDAIHLDPSAPPIINTVAARAAMPAGSLPSLDEELWVIITPDQRRQRELHAHSRYDDDIPGTGSMLWRYPGEPGPREVCLPLAHTDVNAHISSYIASVNVTQRFQNPYQTKIEAMYVFPLPENAAVTGFVMTVGERRIRGILRERGQAERIYQAAKAQGHTASLLTQERPNVFTQHVANIEPGRAIDIDVTYFHTLTYDHGWYEWTFPMVVGPRFNPPWTNDGVGAVARDDVRGSGQSTDVRYLRPNERSGHDISLAATISAGTRIEQLECPTHDINVIDHGSDHMQINLARHDDLPNRDFVLRYRVAGDEVKTAALTHSDHRGGFFSLALYPPEHPRYSRQMYGPPRTLSRCPMEMIFVMDCSGSMKGEPLKQAKDAVLRGLEMLEPGDTFQVIRFSDNSSQFGRYSAPATPDNVRSAQRFVRNLKSGGGTMMIEGVRSALDFPHDPQRLRYVVFLTDGFIGNEMEILGAVHDRIGSSRIFSFGVGSAPNRFLMSRMAKIGRGVVAYLNLADDGAEVMQQFFTRVSHPVMTDIEVDFGDLRATGVQPWAIPDLHAGRPVIVTGRFEGARPADVIIRGRVNGQIVEQTVRIDPLDQSQKHDALAAVWARAHISELMDRATWQPRNIELPQAVTSLALEYGLMSNWTAFVAVDSMMRTAGDHGVTVNVAVPVPAGVRYDTTVDDR